MKGSDYRTCFYCLQLWYKTVVEEIISPGMKMSTQWYICNDEVRNLRITSSPKFHGLFHSFNWWIFSFSSMISHDSHPSSGMYTEVLGTSLSMYNHKPNKCFT